MRHPARYRQFMRISDVIQVKGDGVVTIHSDESVARLLELLEKHRIGALVVSDDDESVTGIVSERDVVRHLHRTGWHVLDGPVSAIMTTNVHTCSLDDDIVDLEQAMTNRRVRHVPVLSDGRLVAIVSIGDVVKSHIASLQTERDHLVDYIQQ